jgi:CRP/FNR family transcriptional regulator
MTIDEALAATPLFARLDRRHRERLARAMTRRRFDAGTAIMRQGTSAVTLYLVLSGAVEVSRSPEEGGGQVTLATLGPGDIFGEMALLDDETRSSTITAREPTECALLSRWEFQEELKRSPEIAITLLAMLSRRVRDLDERLARYEGRRPSE